ncbi:MAG: sulfite exporter TauE/SafE family protein [Bdellovibrionales bacterium]|nr:sulfite exporter TauE/SafE family protein [Bdellovibrionales bacterium]
MHDLYLLLILFLFSVATATLSGVIGMAGGVTLLSLMTFVLPFSAVVPIHGVVQLVSNSSRAYFLRKNIIRPVVGWFALGLPIGVAVTVWLIQQINNKEALLLLIAAMIFYVLLKPKKLPSLKIPMWAFFFVGIAVGFLGPLVGATGPFIAPFFLRNDFSKENIVGTKAAIQFLGHVVKVPAFLYLGFDYLEYLLLIIVMSVGAIYGTNLGVNLLGRVNESLFRRLYQVALFFAALRILYKVFSS